MGLASALSTAVTGLKITQQAVDLTAKNVANADSPGYTSKTLLQEAVIADGETIGVRSSGVARATSRLVQSEYRNELEGYGYADTLGEFYQRIDQLFGTPGSTDALDSLYNNLTESLTQLSGTPESEAMQTQVVADATVLAHRLNGISDDIQTMRQEAETRLSETVDRVNALLGQLETTSSRIVSRTVAGSQPVDLLDQRDQIIDELSRYMDLTLIEREDGGINVLTSTGTLLFDTNAAKLQFNAKTVNGAQTLYNRDDSISDLGTISIVSGAGYSIDLIADNAIRGGELGALIEMRDDILVEAQQQLDEFAAALSRSFSDNPVDGTAVTVGAQDGFDIDLAALQSGDPITLTYTESGNSHVVTFIPTQDGSILPLSDDATARADDTVVGIDFSLGNAAVATQIQAALGANFTVSDQGGSVIRILDDGAAGLVDIDSLDAVATATALTDQGLGFPLFIDGSHSPDAYS
ncbi:MAG: flagellar hook-associated protein FlgK, partial [Rhodobiaceae bacterium]|nr:flagellar hook-associated protein FlgK [Rhodobiaceae bacterium]